MSTKTIVNDLRYSVASTSQEAASADVERVFLPDAAQCKFLDLQYIALDQIIERPVEKDKGKSCLNLWDFLYTVWDIFFPDRGREAYRRLEGDDTTPIVVYKSGSRYYVADGNNGLAAARYLGKAFVLAEVRELP